MSLDPIVEFINAVTSEMYSSGGTQWVVKGSDGVSNSVKVGNSSETLHLQIWNNKNRPALCSDMQECTLAISGTDLQQPVIAGGWLKGKCVAISASEVSMMGTEITKLPVGQTGQSIVAGVGGTIKGTANNNTTNFALVELRFDLPSEGVTHGGKPFTIVLNYFYV